MNRSTQHDNLLKAHVTMKNHHRDLDAGTHVAAWKDRATSLNGRVECVDVELDDRVFDILNSNLQLIILKLSFYNMEKLIHFRLQCSNRHSNQGEKILE